MTDRRDKPAVNLKNVDISIEIAGENSGIF